MRADDLRGEAAVDPGGRSPIDDAVDWELGARVAAVVSRPGPSLDPGEAARLVAELRAAARAAEPHVAAVTHLSAPTGDDDGVLVVDRAAWARVNIRGFRALLAPVVAEAARRRGEPPPAVVTAVGSRVTGLEVGGLLGFLSSRVLGQFDAFSPDGRLLLVAPNVVTVERELDVPPHDFRLWVCLHEETHRVQFGANPWLAPHLIERIRDLVGGLLLEPAQFAERLARALRDVPGLVRGDGSGVPLLDAVQTPDQRAALAELTAVMSLLEGHADVVMDEVGPLVVPTVDEIRERFTRRRAGRGAVDRLLRRLLGLEAKMRQYADGARFVRQVTAEVGVDGFNAVWTGPDTLPSAAEIADPAAWVRRVHG
ncbi:MAG TPA: zinc-dependent metalloprotease [Kineosporiaceae bacterium]|nr:zinc-dependent metalloprotease [Kineosporiaceae bacterium]